MVEPPASWVEKTPGVCGGEARIRRTRIAVWLLVQWLRLGLSETQLLEAYPSLTPADLAAARDYHARHPQEVEEAILRQQAA